MLSGLQDRKVDMAFPYFHGNFFMKNVATGKGGALFVENSNVTMLDDFFEDNVVGAAVSDIYINDDEDPANGGSFVSCADDPVVVSIFSMVFCDGVGGIEEAGLGNFTNTDCANSDFADDPESFCSA